MQEYKENQIQRVNPVIYSGEIQIRPQGGFVDRPYSSHVAEIENQRIKNQFGLGLLCVGALFGIAAIIGSMKPERPIIISPTPVVNPSPATPQNITQPSCTSLCFGG